MNNGFSAVIDTNIFISGVIIPHSSPYQIIRFWQNGMLKLVTSDYIIAEIEAVLQRPKIKEKYQIGQSKIDALITLLKTKTKVVTPKQSNLIVRDPKDQIILDTAIASKANYLVTGDDDLLCLANSKKLNKLNIVTAKKFIQQLQDIY